MNVFLKLGKYVQFFYRHSYVQVQVLYFANSCTNAVVISEIVKLIF